jgi:hypothetical protein
MEMLAVKGRGDGKDICENNVEILGKESIEYTQFQNELF